MTNALVYVSAQGRVVGEKWPADMPAGCAVGKQVLARFPFTDAEWKLSIDTLTKIYPPPPAPLNDERVRKLSELP